MASSPKMPPKVSKCTHDDRLAVNPEVGPVKPDRLLSSIGHDSAGRAEITETWIMFGRCAGGASRSPDESIPRKDAIAAARLRLHTAEYIESLAT